VCRGQVAAQAHATARDDKPEQEKPAHRAPAGLDQQGNEDESDDRSDEQLGPVADEEVVPESPEGGLVAPQLCSCRVCIGVGAARLTSPVATVRAASRDVAW
jgi:hypothetical protein